MALNEAYINNNEGNDTTLYGSSANITDKQETKLADMGDQIREYIQQITQAKENVPPTSKPNTSIDTSSTVNTTIDEMNKRMMRLENMINNMCYNNNNNRGDGETSKNNNSGGEGNENSSNRNGGNTKTNSNSYDNTDGKKTYPFHKHRNMGGYCHSCGFHPVGKTHTSETCGYRKLNHDEKATWTNRGTGGSTVWPKKVREDQKTHEAYAGKSAPTN